MVQTEGERATPRGWATVNRTLKHVTERVLVGAGVPAFGRMRLRQRTLVLAYHNVLPDSESPAGDLSLHLPQRDFARQLDVLTDTHEVVSIDAIWEAAQSPKRPRVVITFDDAYEGAITCGIDELTKRRLPATVFVAPKLLGSVTWWDVLAEQTGGEIPDDVRREALHALGGDARAIIGGKTSRGSGRRKTAKLSRIGSEAQVSKAAARPGITIGSHTWSHPNLASLDAAALDAELRRPREWLESRFGRVVPWLTYPYGIFTDAVQRSAERAGYRGAFRIDGGWMRDPLRSPYAIPRLNIPAGISIDGFRLRLAGL